MNASKTFDARMKSIHEETISLEKKFADVMKSYINDQSVKENVNHKDVMMYFDSATETIIEFILYLEDIIGLREDEPKKL